VRLSQSVKVPSVLHFGSGASRAMRITFSAMKRLKGLCIARLASAGAMLPALAISRCARAGGCAAAAPRFATISARARAFISAILTPVGQTSLQTRQPEQ
jgi:hypothetical protein